MDENLERKVRATLAAYGVLLGAVVGLLKRQYLELDAELRKRIDTVLGKNLADRGAPSKFEADLRQAWMDILEAKNPLPELTAAAEPMESAFGTKRTCQSRQQVSAFGVIADIDSCLLSKSGHGAMPAASSCRQRRLLSLLHQSWSPSPGYQQS
jgi:hypothetical protein